MVREGVLKLAKVDGTKNPADALTKSDPAPTLEKHCEYLLGMRTPWVLVQWLQLPDQGTSWEFLDCIPSRGRG
eukprot:2884284-Rhodomonas_salina.1